VLLFDSALFFFYNISVRFGICRSIECKLRHGRPLKIPLLNVCGTSAISSIHGTIEPPLGTCACLIINKGDVVVSTNVAAAMKGYFHRDVAVILLYPGQSSVNLTGYRTMFVAYKDSLLGPTGLALIVEPDAQQTPTTLTLHIVNGGITTPPIRSYTHSSGNDDRTQNASNTFVNGLHVVHPLIILRHSFPVSHERLHFGNVR
jgi:hypothetical protein